MKKIFFQIAAVALLAGCIENELPQKKEIGSFSISVEDVADDYITKSESTFDINTFEVNITGPYFEWSGTYGSMPELFENVAAGDYQITVASPGQAEAAFDTPSVSGKQEFTVEVDEITSVKVICTIDNVKVSINPTDDFFTELSSYTISVSNGTSAANTLIWTNEELAGANYALLTKENADQARAGYFKVANSLNVYVTGYRAVSQEEAVYEMVISPIAAKDHYILNLHAKTTGQIGGGDAAKGVSIEVDYSTNDVEENIFVPGFEETPVDGPDQPGQGGDPEEPVDPIEPEEPQGLSLVWPANPEYGTYELKSVYSDDEVTLTVNAENCISGFVVKITSPTLPFLSTVQAIAGSEVEGEYVVLDLLKPETAEAMSFLPSGDQLLNKTEVDFPLSSLLPLIIAFEPEYGSVHTFVLEVTDTKGQILSKTLYFEYLGN